MAVSGAIPKAYQDPLCVFSYSVLVVDHQESPFWWRSARRQFRHCESSSISRVWVDFYSKRVLFGKIQIRCYYYYFDCNTTDARCPSKPCRSRQLCILLVETSLCSVFCVRSPCLCPLRLRNPHRPQYLDSVRSIQVRTAGALSRHRRSRHQCLALARTVFTVYFEC